MESSYMYPICAAIITDKGKRADPDRLRLCRDILKAQTGPFSNFRGLSRLSLICMMSVDPNPEQRLKNAQQVYDQLKASFMGSQYLCVAAMVISDLVDPGYYKAMAEHTRRVYHLLKSKHPFLTGSEDSIFSALLAISKKTDDRILYETEQCYTLLKPHFLSNHGVQTLSHVLALCEGRPQEKCDATLTLFRQLRDEGLRYGTDLELPTLGVLAMLPSDRADIIRELREVDEYLAKQKGYGVFGLGKRQRLMHASMIVTGDHLEHCATTQSTLSHSVMALAAAQQAALCAAIAAATAAASASG
jgi:hypothetical protein